MQGYTVTIPARSSTPPTLFVSWYAKHPEDTVQFNIDATAILFDQGVTAVGTPTITASSDLTISAISQAGGISSFLVAGGNDNAWYPITWQLTLSNGLTLTRVIWLPVQSLFPYINGPVIISKGDPGAAGTSLTGSYSIADGDLILAQEAPSASVTLTGFVPTLLAALGLEIQATQTKPTVSGALWDSGGFVEVSDGNP
jgi:hypothetical protein